MLRFALALFLVSIPATTAAAPRVRLGGVGVNASYYSGPAWGYPRYWSPWGLYDPYWYSPMIHPGFYNSFSYGPSFGEVKLDKPSKQASVYLDGAYAGPAHKLKSMWLEPGIYNLEVRDPTGSKYERRIYVLSGKTLRVNPELR